MKYTPTEDDFDPTGSIQDLEDWLHDRGYPPGFQFTIPTEEKKA